MVSYGTLDVEEHFNSFTHGGDPKYEEKRMLRSDGLYSGEGMDARETREVDSVDDRFWFVGIEASENN